MAAPDDFQTGDAKTDAKINSAADKIARGQKPSDDEILALGSGAVGALGIAAGVPGMGPIFAAMLAGELALAAGLDWLFHKLGLHAGAGGGACAELGPPHGPSDPRFIHWDDPHRGAGIGPASSDFERFAVKTIAAVWEVNANCGPTLPFTWQALIEKLAAFWSFTHDGPSVEYAPGGGWGGVPPFGAMLERAVRVNVGPANGRGANVPPRQVGPLHRLGLDPRTYMHAISFDGATWINIDARWYDTSAEATAMLASMRGHSDAPIVAYLRGMYDSSWRTVQPAARGALAFN